MTGQLAEGDADRMTRAQLVIAIRGDEDGVGALNAPPDEAHPNTVRITIERGDRRSEMIGSSLGAGRVLVTQIDGYPVEVSGHFHTIVLVAEDIKGSVARIATLLSEHGLNIATLRLTRKKKGGDAFMVIELDEAPDESVRDDLRSLPWVRWAFRLDKVSA